MSPSPYLPMTRTVHSPLYLRVEDIPEYAALPPGTRAAIEALAAPLRAGQHPADLIDRDAVWAAKRAALELAPPGAAAPRTGRPRSTRFRPTEGASWSDWAIWCALAEEHGPDWRKWPEPLRRPGARPSPPRAERPGAAEFHAWLQWQADEQLAAAQRAARAAGMAHRHHPRPGRRRAPRRRGRVGAARTCWSRASASVRRRTASTSSARTGGSRRGARSALAAPATGRSPDMFAASLRHAGGLRVDHVMGLFRLWWVPEGSRADQGAYVRYDHEALGRGAGRDGAPRPDAVAIGEDLGTVEPWVRDYLAEHGILGTTMLWFARHPDGTPAAAGALAARPAWRRSVTHDVPPVSGFLTGEQVTIRAGLGLLTGPDREERARVGGHARRAGRRPSARRALLAAGRAAGTGEFTVALYGYLRQTPAVLLGVSLADAVGDRRRRTSPARDRVPELAGPALRRAGRRCCWTTCPASLAGPWRAVPRRLPASRGRRPRRRVRGGAWSLAGCLGRAGRRRCGSAARGRRRRGPR